MGGLCRHLGKSIPGRGNACSKALRQRSGRHIKGSAGKLGWSEKGRSERLDQSSNVARSQRASQATGSVLVFIRREIGSQSKILSGGMK